jgi:predicted RNA-binding Zn-ribbon protein involved in translation (DUF1610 family)
MIIIYILGIVVFFYILSYVIQTAIDQSEMHKTLKNIEQLLEANRNRSANENHQDMQKNTEVETGEHIVEEECPACGGRITNITKVCPSCGLTLGD